MPLELSDTTTLRGKTKRDVFMTVYDVQNTIFQTRQDNFLLICSAAKKYLMIMVEIDSNGILVKPLSSCKNEKLTRAYRTLILCLKAAGIVPKNCGMPQSSIFSTINFQKALGDW